MKKYWFYLYPLLFAVFPLIQYYSSNQYQLLINELYLPLLVSLLIIIFFLFVFSQHKEKTSLIATIFLLYFFSNKHFYNFLASYKKFFSLIPLNFKLLSFFIYTLIFLLIFKKTLSINVKKQHLVFLWIVGTYLVVSNIARIAPLEIRRLTIGRQIKNLFNQEVLEELARTEKNPATDPDIYYFILDRYAGEPTLKNYYQFDNFEFYSFLQDHKFYRVENSYANYPKTFSSLASTLNLTHLDHLTNIIGEDSSDNTALFMMVQNNLVAQYLKKRGYRYYYFGDWWEPTRISRLADENINLYAGRNEFIRKFLQTTILEPITTQIIKKGDILGFSENLVRDNHLYKFRQLKKIVDRPGPKYIFAHLLLPHHPYVFDESCAPYSSPTDGKQDFEYINQLRCTNKKMTALIARILSRSKKPPIIIIQSDEGNFKIDEMNDDGEGVDWTKVSDEAIAVHMKILNALYLPDFDRKNFSAIHTPVNTFRLIFNYYFKTKFKMLPDRAYFIPHLNYPYRFYDITDKLKKF